MHFRNGRRIVRVRGTAAVASLLLACVVRSDGKEWRGIVPLRSTRADVERLLGRPATRPSEGASFYELKDAVAVVWFETAGCEGDTLSGACGQGWNVPRDTVTNIGVVLKRPRPASDVFSAEGFRAEASCEGLVYYRNEREGLEVETYKGEVLSLTYSPAEAEDHLRCPARPERCRIADVRKFDEYGDIRFADERARLDNVAVELQNAPDLRLGILAYGGRVGRPGEAIRRAARARDYLVRVRNIKPWQIVAASCGYREDLTVELLPLGIGFWRVYPSPSVDPGEVRFTEGRRRPRARERSRRR